MPLHQPIVGYHLDDESHWVAELACGHQQHVRHDPPWQNRPWVTTDAGRRERLGALLPCRKCDVDAPRDWPSPAPGVTLRTASLADAEPVARILIDTRSAFMPYAPSAHPDDELRAWVRDRLLPSGGVTVAEQDGRVLATMATSLEGGVSWITQMAVAPAFVNHRIGSLLLSRALRTLTRPIRLHTFQANAGARRFYERHGFVPIAFTDGLANEEHCPDVLYELRAPHGA
jgi:GNAT superfamily N-acetyltransferase